MPFATVHNARMFYRLQGNAGRPVLILSHSISTDHAMWELQIGDLLPHFQILLYDTRGHGASEATTGEYSIEMLGKDILALADALEISQFAFCGLSLGGAIGQWVAVHAPERLTHLVLANTSAQFIPRANWETRIAAVVKGGMSAVVDVAMERFFSPDTLAKQNPSVASIRSVFLGTDPVGYLGCCAALRDMNHLDLLRQIKSPTLVISGERDVATPWSGHGEMLAREIPGAKTLHLAAAHLSNIERPHSFTTALFEFLLAQPSSGSDLLRAGFEVRRAVLGDAHVDSATANTTEFTREFQEVITRYAWGTIWSRPELDRRTRRLLALAITASLGRWEEFALHVRTGLVNDLELCDLKEVLLQTAVYAGTPAANTGFRIAAEQIGKKKDD
ncbi:MAG TPA: 3-oxoadipate enol-lactonase [Candidatus Polarisedimenticolia bacterium]|nr:3-oxoadipate enol-lactonase [Candidatus Polarisedimenticolia bacterium]